MTAAGKLPITSERLFLLLITIAASFLLFWNLDDQVLWQDEAQTATIAGTIREYGVPKGYDGKNYFSQEYGAEYGENYVWKWHTWLSFYLVAGSFEVFGRTTFAARFPSVLFALGTVLLTYFASKSFFQNPRVAILATVLLAISVPFLILSRQCRYYAPAMFFSLLGLYSYTNMLRDKKHSTPVFVAASTLLFHTHYIYCAILLATVGFHAFLFRQQLVRRVIMALVAVVVISLPWIVWFLTMKYGERYGENLFSLEQVIQFSKVYHRQIGLFLFPFGLLIIPVMARSVEWVNSRVPPDSKFSLAKRGGAISLVAIGCVGMLWAIFYVDVYLEVALVLCLTIAAVVKRSPTWENIGLLVLFFAVTLSAVLLSVPYPFFRYLAPLIPICCILAALLVEQAMRMHILLGLEIMILLLVTGQMPDYLDEISHTYKGPMDGIVRYLQHHGAPDDTVVITYEDLPVKFYTGMKVAGGLTGEDVSPYVNAQWIIVRKHQVERDSTVRNHLRQAVQWKHYEKITLPYPDIRFQNREDPEGHLFRTARVKDSVTIFRRMH